MRKVILVLTLALLAGCATPSRWSGPSTPEQRAMAFQMYMQMQQQRQPSYQPMPTYQAPAYQMPVRQHTNCTTSFVGGTAYTNCY